MVQIEWRARVSMCFSSRGEKQLTISLRAAKRDRIKRRALERSIKRICVGIGVDRFDLCRRTASVPCSCGSLVSGVSLIIDHHPSSGGEHCRLIFLIFRRTRRRTRERESRVGLWRQRESAASLVLRWQRPQLCHIVLMTVGRSSHCNYNGKLREPPIDSHSNESSSDRSASEASGGLDI